LYDILSQQRSGKLACEIPFILSNHKDLSFIAEQFNIPFYHIPVTKENKKEAKGSTTRTLVKIQNRFYRSSVLYADSFQPFSPCFSKSDY
jgi:formyltetrahydrofolate deformylase